MTAPLDNLIENAYRVTIDVGGVPGTKPDYWEEGTNIIRTFLPQEGFSLEGGTANYDSPLSLGGDTVNTISQFFTGTSVKSAEFEQQIWKGTDPIDVTMPLGFIAWEDPWEDVVRPAMILRALTLPTPNQQTEGFLQDPPVKLGSVLDTGVSVVLDDFTFPGVLPNDATPDFAGTKCRGENNERAWPVAATVNFSARISQIPSRLSEKMGIIAQEPR